MQFSDLRPIQQAGWCQVIEPSGEKVKEKLKQAEQAALEQQQSELIKAVEELHQCSPAEGRKYIVLHTKCTKTNGLGQPSYPQGTVTRHRTALNDTYANSTHPARLITEEIAVAHKKVEIAALFAAQSDAENVMKRLKESLGLFCAKKLTYTGIWNALKVSFPAMQAGSSANLSLRIGNVLFNANIGETGALIVDHDGRTIQQLSPVQSGSPEISKYELQPGKMYTLVQSDKGIYETMTKEHVGYFMMERTEDLETKTDYLAYAAIEDFASAGNISIITRLLLGE